MVFVPPVQTAGAIADELHAAPINPEYIRYMNENLSNSRMQEGTHRLGVIPSQIYRPEIRDIQMFGPNTGDRSSSYPSLFDLRALGKVSPVKDQSPFGTCWAFATYASLESTLMPATPTPNFSEKNLVNLAGLILPGPPQEAGGFVGMSTAYLARWNGPVNSATDPYPAGTWTSSNTYPPVIHVQNVVFFPGRTNRTDTNNIKGGLTRWGALYTVVSAAGYDAFSYYNETYTSYYQPASDPNSTNPHAVAFIGWNDAYESTNFTIKPPGPGAWIVKNSWGTKWGEGGFFYVSYYDKFIGSAIDNQSNWETAALLGESTSNYDSIYSYDKLGEELDYSYGTNKTGSFANVFTANSSETIKAVGFYTTDLAVPYTIKIYKNPTPEPVGGTPAATFSGTLPYMGYNTVVIPSSQQVPVKAGDRFSVVVHVTNPTNDEYIPIETSGNTSQYGQSYVLDNIGWKDLKTIVDNRHVCVKAYTSSTTPVSTVGVFRNGTFYLRNSNSAGNADNTFAYGAAGDTPLAGDWTGQGKDTAGVFRQGVFYLKNSNSAGNADNTFAFGSATDKPLVGHWTTGQTGDTIDVFRQGQFYLASNNTNGGGEINALSYGSTGDIPITGDWTGQGKDTVGIFRSGIFYLKNENSAGNADNTFSFGAAGDIPVVWHHNGKDTVGVFRSGTFYLKDTNSAGNADNVFTYGAAGDTPVTGKWV